MMKSLSTDKHILTSPDNSTHQKKRNCNLQTHWVLVFSHAMSHHGVVKFYNSLDGFGFLKLRAAAGRVEVYVHRSAIADGKMLVRGDRVSFDVPLA